MNDVMDECNKSNESTRFLRPRSPTYCKEESAGLSIRMAPRGRGHGVPRGGIESRFMASTRAAISAEPMPAVAKRVAADIMELIVKLFPTARWTRRDLNALVTEAYRVTDDDYGEQEAIAWANKFKFLVTSEIAMGFSWKKPTMTLAKS